MFFYRYQNQILASQDKAEGFEPAAFEDAQNAGQLTFLFKREPLLSRARFAPNDIRQLCAESEDCRFLDCSRLPSHSFLENEEKLLNSFIQKGALCAVNLSHPRYRELLDIKNNGGKKRVNILAIGDVGSTLLTGLKLMGGDVISEIGICDLSEKITARWEFEMNQVSLPWEYDAFPTVKVVTPENLFDCDVFVFVASKGIPPVGSGVKDVRMAQFEANSAIMAHYAKMARKAKFAGLFAAVSDPVDPLAKTALIESNKDENGDLDYNGLFPEQIQGFGLGVMNARAAYYAKRDSRFASFLTEGRSFGPHGQDLVIANSVENYDDALSRELTQLTVTANLAMRELGYKPYVAPALSSGALSLLLSLRGKWHCGSVYLGGAYMGVKNRFTSNGLEAESIKMPDALFERIELAYSRLKEII